MTPTIKVPNYINYGYEIGFGSFILTDFPTVSDNVDTYDFNLNAVMFPQDLLYETSQIVVQNNSEVEGIFSQVYNYPQGTEFLQAMVPGTNGGYLNLCLISPAIVPGIFFWGPNQAATIYSSTSEIQFTLIFLNSSGNAIYQSIIHILTSGMVYGEPGTPSTPEPEPEPVVPNKDYSTIQNALSILGGTMSGRNQKDFIRKFELINLKADSSKLTKYGNNDYVCLEDIKKTSTTQKTTIIEYSGTPSGNIALSLTPSKPFNPSKGFEIIIIATPNTSGFVRLFTIHSQTINGTPREIQVYGDTSTNILHIGCIKQDGTTYYHQYESTYYQNVKLNIGIFYDVNSKEYTTIVNSVTKVSTIDAINRDCNYCYINGEKYYSSGRGNVSYNKVNVKN